jgi:uncharacterized surface protein with fasciclin (FAS1) repeats
LKLKMLAAAMVALLLAARPIFAAGPEKDIVDTAVAVGSFKTLVAAVKAAGLAETLKGKSHTFASDSFAKHFRLIFMA